MSALEKKYLYSPYALLPPSLIGILEEEIITAHSRDHASSQNTAKSDQESWSGGSPKDFIALSFGSHIAPAVSGHSVYSGFLPYVSFLFLRLSYPVHYKATQNILWGFVP